MLRHSLRLLSLSTALALLSGCLHLQLYGSLTDAELRITSVHDANDTVLHTAESRDKAYWLSFPTIDETVWQDWGPLLQLALVGTVDTNAMTDLQDDAYYLVTVTSGVDRDAAQFDRMWDENGVPLGGKLHAVLTGEQIRKNDGKVSILTEILYQAMFIETGTTLFHDDNWYLVELDKFAPRLVGDLNEDGEVTYDDVLKWNAMQNPEAFIGDTELLNEYRDLVLNGTASDAPFDANIDDDAAYVASGGRTDDERFNLAVAILDSGIDTSHPLAGTWALDVASGTLECVDFFGVETSDTLAAFSEEVNVSIEDGQITFPQNDWSAVPDFDIVADTGISGNFNAGNNSFTATQVLTGIPIDDPTLGEQSINVTYTGQFNGESWSGTYAYDFRILLEAEYIDLQCESTQDFSGSKLD